MANYRFLTTWCLDAPRERVWDAIYSIDEWPDWWKGVESVTKLREGDENGVGACYRHVWRSRVPYAVRFDIDVTAVEPPFRLEGVARGELEGIGHWRLFEGDGTAVTYEWNVRTTRPWMNAAAPRARPIFVWSHNAVMRQGGQGLARLLGATLVAQS